LFAEDTPPFSDSDEDIGVEENRYISGHESVLAATVIEYSPGVAYSWTEAAQLVAV
jgi:hypothetical protein